MSAEFLEVDDLGVIFPVTSGVVLRRKVGEIVAVKSVSFSLARSRSLGIVGESGCGKSTLLRAILQLTSASRGEVRLDGAKLSRTGKAQLRDFRRRVQVVFQDPFVSLDPRMKVKDIIREPIDRGRLLGPKCDVSARVAEVLQLVGLDPAAGERYPHQFSGGQKQRIAIARAIAPRPELILLDEPTSALDVSVRAQVLNLLIDLRRELGLTYILVSHDLDAVAYLCDDVIVMYLGRVVEAAKSAEIYAAPRHPYTQLLLKSAREAGAGEGGPGADLDPPSALSPPPGCPFHPRCTLHERLGRPALCREVEPVLANIAPGRRAACHFADEAIEPAPERDAAG